MNTKQQVIQARLNGMPYNEIQRHYGVPRSTAFRWVKAYENEVITEPETGFLNFGSEFDSSIEGHINENLQREKPARFKKTEDEVFSFLEQLAPINVTVPQTSTYVKESNDYAVVIGDMHFPKHCPKTLEIFFEVVAELRPKTIVLNGDTLDLFAVSRYSKDIRHQYSLLDERVAYQSFLKELISLAPDDATIYEVNANHSGNDVNGRWWRYLSERIGELGCLPDIRERLSYEEVFLGKFTETVNLVDYVNLTDDFVIMHGDVVRKNGGYSARGMLDKFNISLMHNHTHRFGATAQRIPGIGKRPDTQVYAWENACACDLKPVYASAPNWQNGFSIIGLDKCADKELYSVEQVRVDKGMAHVSTLGRTIVAG
jgi:hypothetical protein